VGDNIKIYLKETGCEGVICIHLAQDSVHWQVHMNMRMYLRVP